MITFALIGGILVAVFISYIMFRVVSLMEDMSGSISEISTNISSMNNAMIHMGKDVHIMEEEISDISLRIMLMDSHMFTMNKTISTIQTRLADSLGHMTEDMNIMTSDVHGLTQSIKLMSSSVHNMSQDMHRMGYDIYRGSSSYTSPPSFIRNMMNPR